MTLYPRLPEAEESLSGIQVPSSLQNTTSELAISAMGILGDGKNPSALTRLSQEQVMRLMTELGLSVANDNRAPVAEAA